MFCPLDVCEPYQGSFCQEVSSFNDSNVYIDKVKMNGGQAEIEQRMVGLFHQASHLSLTPGCRNALKQFICHSALPFCNADEASGGSVQGMLSPCIAELMILTVTFVPRMEW